MFRVRPLGPDRISRWTQAGSNRRPFDCQSNALPAELWARGQKSSAEFVVVRPIDLAVLVVEGWSQAKVRDTTAGPKRRRQEVTPVGVRTEGCDRVDLVVRISPDAHPLACASAREAANEN